MIIDDLQARTRALFRTEAMEILGELEQALLDLEKDLRDGEAVNRVFRAMHTLKGSGATAGHRALSKFVHSIEDFYNAVREGRTLLEPRHIGQTLQAKDALFRSLEVSEEEATELFAHAAAMLGPWEANDSGPVAGMAPASRAAEPVKWKVRVAAKPELWMTGLDVGVFWDDLATMGVFSIRADLGGLPGLDHFNPELCALAWDIELETSVSKKEILEVFAFAGEDAVVTVERLQRVATAPPVTKAAVSGPDLLKVGADKVDRLVNLVGELVVLRAQLTNACTALGEVPPALSAAEEGLRRLSEQMREVVLGVRMMRIEEAFAKFRRVVRDLAGELHKEVEWHLEGGDTEMDKTMLDRLAEPLLHMVRNALDHGIESPEERLTAGKPKKGRILLRAEQRGDRVWLALSDDGRGLDPLKIRAKALSKGLIAADTELSQKELYDLVFLPGFSTAESVSQVSGRGVGMDVVKRSIESLRGVVEIQSQVGKGTEIRINLPLTLAIVDGLLVEAGGERYVLPLSAARETVELPPEERHARDRGQFIHVRGEHVPYFRLRSLFGVPGSYPAGEMAVILTTESGQFSIVVDRVIGQHQTVLKTLGWMSTRVQAFSGCTILGDGRVALVLDLNALWTMGQSVNLSEKRA